VSCVSGSQGTAALAAAGRYDRPAGAGAHAQPESVNPRPPPIVRLEGPFTLSHGDLSSSHLAARPAEVRRRTSPDIETALVQAPQDTARSRNPVAAVPSMLTTLKGY